MRNYKLLAKLLITKHAHKDGIPFKFECYDTVLKQRAFFLVCFSMSMARPKNKTLVMKAWENRRKINRAKQGFIYRYFQFKMVSLPRAEATEECINKRASHIRMQANGNAKGVIVAIDVKTFCPKFLYGPTDMRQYGFQPETVYSITSKGSGTHHGHVFVREIEVFNEQSKTHRPHSNIFKEQYPTAQGERS